MVTWLAPTATATPTRFSAIPSPLSRTLSARPSRALSVNPGLAISSVCVIR